LGDEPGSALPDDGFGMLVRGGDDDDRVSTVDGRERVMITGSRVMTRRSTPGREGKEGAFQHQRKHHFL